MKRFTLIFTYLLFSTLAFSQENSPVSWDVSIQQTDSTHYTIRVVAAIEGGWHIYGHNPSLADVPPVSVIIENEVFRPAGKLHISPEPLLIEDKVFTTRVMGHVGSVLFSQAVVLNGKLPPSVIVKVNGFASNGEEFLPLEYSKEVVIDQQAASDAKSKIKRKSIDLASPAANCGNSQNEERGLAAIFLLGFLGGLIALFTPCVFPMIPVTVSFFINKSSSRSVGLRNAVTYGIFILLLYTAASVPFHLAGSVDPQIFNTISTSATLNIIFGIVFIFFALSFFGLFEITLPSFIANKANNSAGIQSMVGIFFMALTITIVSFSCTGPILGSLLAGTLASSGNGAWALTAGMSGFGLALGLPFALFAMFPQWLKVIPKSGGWMDTLKKVLAFVELALALKFISNADLVEHWGIFKREVFFACWFVISLSLAAYLLNLKRFVTGAKRNISIARIMLGCLVLCFSFYLVPGMANSRYANLALVSGFPPPLSYSIYGKESKAAKLLEPDVINDLERAEAIAKETGKPILVDFTGWACVNCRKMEEFVWTDPEVTKLIKEKYVLVSLYVDDREKLPAGERFVYRNDKGESKSITTIGDKYATIQAENFRQVTQPMYALLSPDGKLLNHPVGYTPDADEYKDWLNCGLNSMQDQISKK